MRVHAEIEHFSVSSEAGAIHAAIERDGAAIVEGLLPLDVVARVNEEVEAAVAAADPREPLFNPIMTAFHGEHTKQVTGVPGMCHPFLLALCDRILLPSCARYQECCACRIPVELLARGEL